MAQKLLAVSERQPYTLDQVLIVDTETTGLEVDTAQVIEIGAILYSVKHQTTIQQFSTMLPANTNPAEHINRIKSAPLREITEKQAAQGILILTEMAQMAEVVVAHNAEFDKKWFGLSRNGNSLLPALLNYKGKPLSWVCTCSDFEWPYQTRPGQSLIELAAAHDIGIFGTHRALTDCQLIAALFDRMENLEAMFEKALRPKAFFKALVTYDEREKAKKVGFKWIPERKSWERRMAVEDSKKLPFPVMQIAPC
ncbi:MULTISPECIES: 3'-5' exonuclease [unclassified Coleofasciculus]|uniref:3'-5' exonuclease n=1 Tax=unclassified Coleofasciculus TaxID=2692782 RepID=UPI001882D1F2|nr:MULTISPECIES: 3'-5' exonuclease [unclassified Coleofasciculus]MBE9126002.1 3'-5' exonuclease [Coleofasciculus sp. LEGE 07081]MBE9149377.1 3'-5' exonuclease [Coleofasciculus sp. LEGE 07092]